MSPLNAKLLDRSTYDCGPRSPAPSEPRLHELRITLKVAIDEEMVWEAVEYFTYHDPPLDEIESLSVEGGPLELESDNAPIISDEALN